MEDSYDTLIDSNEQINIFSVFDGHGGYECAEFCKATFNKKLHDNIVRCDNSSKNVTENVHKVIKKTFDEVDKTYCKLCEQDETRVDGSTATIVI